MWGIMMAFAGNNLHVLIIVENLPLPFDRRVWQEANSLVNAGHEVSIICPVGKGYEKRYERLNGVDIYRHPLPLEGSGAAGYVLEYGTALFWEFYLAVKIFSKKRFEVIQACNPPDNIFVIGAFFKLFFRTKFIFDHHDINPELYIAKFGRKGFFYRVMLWWERLTFLTADYSIATNESYKKIAVERGKMSPEKVVVVRSGPSFERMKIVPPNSKWKQGKTYLVGYVGVMGRQEGIDHLLEAVHHIVFGKKRKDIHFVLVGSGTELDNLKELCDQQNITDYVTFTGRIPDEPMLEALSTSDVCVNPDIANEMNDKSTMNKIMEYMALGKPIVQYDLTEGRFSAQRASLYAEKNNPVDLAEKIVFLLENKAVREEMGAWGQQRVRNELHWGIEERKYLGLYEKLR